ncbi:MAG: hypothetical protein IJE48_02465 [Clostridia bacterium]|nr:hypothetical protein [Clostridia bacterium]
MCYLGGFTGDGLMQVFGIWCEETDSLPEGMKKSASFCGKGKAYYAAFRNGGDFADDFCDILIKENVIKTKGIFGLCQKSLLFILKYYFD